MEKEFVPYEQALALKQLGFDEPCLGFYYKLDDHFLLEIPVISYRENKNSIIDETFDNNSDCITAPTFSQAFRWFREKIIFRISEHKDKNGERFSVVTINDANFKQEYSTYEEAELECLKKLIEIVKSC